jgi:hypothetical protein
MAPFHAHPVLDAVDRQTGVPGEQLIHHALEIGREVLDHQIGHFRFL